MNGATAIVIEGTFYAMLLQTMHGGADVADLAVTVYAGLVRHNWMLDAVMLCAELNGDRLSTPT